MSSTYRGPHRPPGIDTWEPAPPAGVPLELPEDDDSFTALARFLTIYFIDNVDGPLSLQQIQLLPSMVKLSQALSNRNNPGMIAALLWCRMDFAAHTANEDRHGINNSRALACEVVAIECVGYLSEHDVVQYLSYEVPGKQEVDHEEDSDTEGGGGNSESTNGLLRGGPVTPGTSVPGSGITTPINSDDIRDMDSDLADDIAATCGGLNTLEIGIVANAKHFLSQKSVQHVVDGIWEGRVVFWEGLNVTGRKRPHLYNKRKADPYSRLRVPKYQKFFETCFLATFTILYYAVLVERNPDRITNTETVLLFFFVAFAVEELTQWIDAGTLFYSSDIWSWLDMFVILIGLAFLACRIIGLVREDDDIVDISFDILSLEALFLVPRRFDTLLEADDQGFQ
ncbi:hypothetical protein DFH27DRAFT_354904 [Peziza echinospora]|nr:hypothetical protein DFH27DRAFT_354904 [Peziza echinospora]